MMTIPEQLRAAAHVIREEGWGHGTDAGVCAANAIFFDVGSANGISIDQSLTAQDVLCHALGLNASDSPESIWDWNDAPEQTAENVIAGLEYAAFWYEQQQAQQQAKAVLVPCEA